MKKLALGILCAGFLVVTGCGGDTHTHITLDAGSGTGTCDPLKQTGCPANEKCTWLIDAIAPNYVGHVGCAPAGAGAVGETCKYGGQGTMGYDDCGKGLVCGNYRGGYCPAAAARACMKNTDCNPGEGCTVDGLCAKRCVVDGDCDAGGTCMGNTDVCKTVCDQLEAAGNAACDSSHACVIYSALFSTGDTTPAAAGVCDTKCDPFADNDFDGAGTSSNKTGTTCGSNQGCYGYPSFGTAPVTNWTCTRDINIKVAQPAGLRHRTECTEDNRCADAGPKIYTNSCNQGYLPLLKESATVSTTICVAMCEPVDCSMGACGLNDLNRLGKQPNRCNLQDRVGTFNLGNSSDAHPNGEECTYLWWFELDSMNNNKFLRSDRSDTMGFCYDHSQYPFDLNGDGTADVKPPCGALPIQGPHTDMTNPLAYYGAADFGCVNTSAAGVSATGKGELPAGMVEAMRHIDRPRALYNRSAEYR